MPSFSFERNETHKKRIIDHIVFSSAPLFFVFFYSILSPGTYGLGCKSKCNRCKNGAECHHITGTPLSFSNRFHHHPNAHRHRLAFCHFQDNAAACQDGAETIARCLVHKTPGGSPAPSAVPVSTTAPAGLMMASAAVTMAGWDPSAMKVRPSRFDF